MENDQHTDDMVDVDQTPSNETADPFGAESPMGDTPMYTAPMPVDNGGMDDDTDEFQLPKTDWRGLKYLGYTLVAILLLVLVAYLGHKAMAVRTVVDTGAGGDHASAPAAQSSADAATSSDAPNMSMPQSAPSGHVTVRAPAFDTYDLSNCTRADLEITPDGTWIFRNCAKPVLPSSASGH